MRKNAVASTGEEDSFPVLVQTMPFSDGDLSVGNPSYIMTYDVNDNMLTVDMLLDGTTYRKTMTYDANDNMLTASAWVRV